ncbi:MAG: class I SAM-dependent methyltransferase [Candidatus Omnitrophota bacterium]|jgi:SAM-dependent methyltransferase
MDKVCKEYIRICSQTLPIIEPIYEFGAQQVGGQEGFADLRPFFTNQKYVGADIVNGLGVDVILNLHNINLASESVGTVVTVGTLEHVEFPRKAIAEIHRILKPDGILILTTVMNHPHHSTPDYWRFTTEGLEILLKDFTTAIVDFTGEKKFPNTIVAIAAKAMLDEKIIQSYKERIYAWKKYSRKIERISWSRLLMPPLLYGLDRKIKKAWRGIK